MRRPSCILALLALACASSPLHADVLILDEGSRQVEGEVLEVRSDGISFRAKIGGIWSTQFFPNDRIEKLRCKEGNQCDLELGEDSPGMRPDANGNPQKPTAKKPAQGGKAPGAPTGGAAGKSAPAAAKTPSGPAGTARAAAWKVGAMPQASVKPARAAEARTSVVAALEVAIAERKAIDDALELIAREQEALARGARDPDRDEAKDRARQVELFFEPDRLGKLIPPADEQVVALTRVAEKAELARRQTDEAAALHRAGQLPGARALLAAADGTVSQIAERWTTERTALSAAWNALDAAVIADETAAAARDLEGIYEDLDKAAKAKDWRRTVDALQRLGAEWTPRAVAQAMRDSSDKWAALLPVARTAADPTGAELSALRHGQLYEATRAIAALSARIHQVNKSWGKVTGIDQIHEALEPARLAYAEQICEAAVDDLEDLMGDAGAFRSRQTSEARLSEERALLEDALSPPLTALEWQYARKADRERAVRILSDALEAIWSRTNDASFELIATMRHNGESRATADGGEFPRLGPLSTVADAGTLCAGLLQAMVREIDDGQRSVDVAARSPLPEWSAIAERSKGRFAAARERAQSRVSKMLSMQREYDSNVGDLSAIVDLESDDTARRAEGLAAFIRRHFSVKIDAVGIVRHDGVERPAVQFRIDNRNYRCVMKGGNAVIFTYYLDAAGNWIFVPETFFDNQLALVRATVLALFDREKPFLNTDHLWRYCRNAHGEVFAPVSK